MARRTRKLSAEEIARAERMAAAREAVADAARRNRCPSCGGAVRRNLSLTGWWQCAQFGAPQFRADPRAPSCDWQGFAE